MTRADLIEEVSRRAELPRKDSELIVETIFDSVVRALRAGRGPKFVDLAASVSGSASHALAAIHKLATGSRFLRKRFPSSNPAKS